MEGSVTPWYFSLAVTDIHLHCDTCSSSNWEQFCHVQNDPIPRNVSKCYFNSNIVELLERKHAIQLKVTSSAFIIINFQESIFGLCQLIIIFNAMIYRRKVHKIEMKYWRPFIWKSKLKYYFNTSFPVKYCDKLCLF